MKYEVTWPAAWAQSRRHCQRATSSARPLKKGSTDAAPRDSRGLWQHATLSEERGQHRRSTAGPENRSTFTPPRGLKVERGERAGSSLAEKKRGAPAPLMWMLSCRMSNVPVACCIWNVVSCMSCVECSRGMLYLECCQLHVAFYYCWCTIINLF